MRRVALAFGLAMALLLLSVVEGCTVTEGQVHEGAQTAQEALRVAAMAYAEHERSQRRCASCGGTGRVVCWYCGGSGHGMVLRCYTCGSTGYTACASCNGTGR